MTLINGQGYYCDNCNLYNDILSSHCRDCHSHRNPAYNQAAIWIRYKRGIDDVIEWCDRMSDSSKIDKFSGFFNSGKILYSSMSFDKRREWRDELAEILMTARANLSAADWIDREESAKLSPEQRQYLETNKEDNGNLLTPKLRKERQSKADKLREQMSSLGLDLTQVNSIMSSVEKTVKDKDLNSLVFRKSEESKPTTSELCRIGEHIVCVGSFKDDSGSHVCNCDCHNVGSVVNSDNGSDKPNPAVFDFSSLKFGE